MGVAVGMIVIVTQIGDAVGHVKHGIARRQELAALSADGVGSSRVVGGVAEAMRLGWRRDGERDG